MQKFAPKFKEEAVKQIVERSYAVSLGMIAAVSLALFAALTPAHVAACVSNILPRDNQDEVPFSPRLSRYMTWTRGVMIKLRLSINEAKTSVRDARKERFDFLGYAFGPHCFKKNGRWYPGASPSKRSIQRFKTSVGDLLVPANVKPWDEVSDKLNSMLFGWSNYFAYGTTSTTTAYRQVDWHVYQRVRDFLARRHKVRGRGTVQFSIERVYGELGLIRLEKLPRSKPAVGLQ
jgi:RNA-directed DNA polymerase